MWDAVVDTDLRWRLVTALAAAGEIDADGVDTPVIDQELANDPTAAGKRQAAAAATARPIAEVKEQAWATVISGLVSIVNVTIPSTSAGVSPASSNAARTASTASRSSLRPESLENSVAPIPTIAACPPRVSRVRVLIYRPPWSSAR